MHCVNWLSYPSHSIFEKSFSFYSPFSLCCYLCICSSLSFVECSCRHVVFFTLVSQMKEPLFCRCPGKTSSFNYYHYVCSRVLPLLTHNSAVGNYRGMASHPNLSSCFAAWLQWYDFGQCISVLAFTALQDVHNSAVSIIQMQHSYLTGRLVGLAKNSQGCVSGWVLRP